MKSSEQKPQSCKTDISDIFTTVIAMVEDGWDISKALSKIGANRSTFYKKISKEQKLLLNIAKTTNTKYGAGSLWK